MEAWSTDHTRTGMHLGNSGLSLAHQLIGLLQGVLLSYEAGRQQVPVTLSFKSEWVLFSREGWCGYGAQQVVSSVPCPS